MKRLVQCALLLVTCWSAQAQGTYEAITGYSTTSPIVAPVTATAGWVFKPTADIDVLALGCFDYIVADRGSISIGLWNSTGTLLASNLVTSASTLVNETRYQDINLIRLTASATYYLGAYSPDGFGPRLIGFNEGETFTASPGIQQSSIGYTMNSVGFGFPPAVAGGEGILLLAPNLRYQVVPEPSTLTLFGLGALSLVAHLRRRR